MSICFLLIHLSHFINTMGRRGPKPWTTTEQEEFLMARLPDYIKCQPTRHYNDFIVNTNLAFLAKWPERAHLHGQGIPAEGLLTPQQDAIVKIATEKRKIVSDLNTCKYGPDKSNSTGHCALVPVDYKYSMFGTIRQLECCTRFGSDNEWGRRAQGHKGTARS